MKVGDLVWHKDDIKDSLNIPGLVTLVSTHDASVRFSDQAFDEIHDIDELTAHPAHEYVAREDENIMGNPE